MTNNNTIPIPAPWYWYSTTGIMYWHEMEPNPKFQIFILNFGYIAARFCVYKGNLKKYKGKYAFEGNSLPFPTERSN